jgi:hypothetical protein
MDQPKVSTLHVDRDAIAAPHRVRSFEEAVSRLIAADYRALVLHTRVPGGDDYGLISYLDGTWPQFLRTLSVRSVCGSASYVWSHAAGRFEREAPAPRRLGSRDEVRSEMAV